MWTWDIQSYKEYFFQLFIAIKKAIDFQSCQFFIIPVTFQ